MIRSEQTPDQITEREDVRRGQCQSIGHNVDWKGIVKELHHDDRENGNSDG